MKKLQTALTLPALAALGMLVCASNASAGPITCNVNNANANGDVADACKGDNAIGANPASETTFVNGAFAPGGFAFVDKTGEASAVAGFELTVETGAADPYKFLYSLVVPTQWLGAVVDWVLVIKQANNSTIAYFFDDVTLGIDGGFNSFWLNPKEKLQNDFSHASGFIRGTPTTVPEPGALTLTLLGLTLVGARALRRRRS